MNVLDAKQHHLMHQPENFQWGSFQSGSITVLRAFRGNGDTVFRCEASDLSDCLSLAYEAGFYEAPEPAPAPAPEPAPAPAPEPAPAV